MSAKIKINHIIFFFFLKNTISVMIILIFLLKILKYLKIFNHIESDYWISNNSTYQIQSIIMFKIVSSRVQLSSIIQSNLQLSFTSLASLSMMYISTTQSYK